MDEQNKSKRTEAREFWKEAIRLWGKSGLSVRDFCAREGLTAHTFYVRRRMLLLEDGASEHGHEAPVASCREPSASCRGQRSQKSVIANGAMNAAITSPFVELVSSSPAGLCRCTLELEDADGAKMRIELHSVAMPDVAAITQGFWNHSS